MIVLDNPDQLAAEEAFGCEVKRCKVCDEWMPADAEFYWRDTRSRDGLMRSCKVCWKEVNRLWDRPRNTRAGRRPTV